jgi:hypothetical protein
MRPPSHQPDAYSQTKSKMIKKFIMLPLIPEGSSAPLQFSADLWSDRMIYVWSNKGKRRRPELVSRPKKKL